MKKGNKTISLFITFLFIFSFFPKFSLHASDTHEIKADTMAVLVGDFLEANSLGKNWEPTNDKSIMKEYQNGIYELTVNFKAAGNYSYKVAFNGSWQDAYGKNGKGGENVSLAVVAPCKVTFRVNLKENTLEDSINNKDKFKAKGTLVGSLSKSGGQDWAPGDSNFDLDYLGEGFYKKTFSMKAGDYEYKIAYDHKWSNGEVGSNIKLKVPADEEVTFIGNPDLSICTDSINNPYIKGTVSLIGTIRNIGDKNWEPSNKDFDFSYLTGDGKFIYGGKFNKGSYEYKAVEDYSFQNGGIPSSGNVSISILQDNTYVIFIADRKAKTIIDSVNNKDKVYELLGFKNDAGDIKSPVINENGTVTFMYKNPSASSVSLRGNVNEWGETPMTKDKNGIWSLTLRIGDEAKDVQYKYFVDGKDWIKDPVNAAEISGNSLLKFPKYEGRKVVVPGSIQAVVNAGSWDPASEVTKMTYTGNGLYKLVLKNVPVGKYEYKVAMGSWKENYGAGGVKDGANIQLEVPSTQDITFMYNDDSKRIVDSISYKFIDAVLCGSGVPQGSSLKDPGLTGIYSIKAPLKAGTYEDFKIKIAGKGYEIPVGEIKLDKDKVVTISYDPITEMVFNDLSNTPLDNSITFDSKDLEYKSPYGAAPTGSNITFNIDAGKNKLSKAKLKLMTPEGLKLIDMTKNGTFKRGGEKWTASFETDKIGQYKYSFIVSNGSDVKAYGDDDGYFGKGKLDSIGSVKDYDLNIYDKNYKTPDWMKNAVVYQIFPDRFFNGDCTNDYEEKLARGNTKYEFYNDWYSIPEDPQIEDKSDYAGTKGDKVWSNEMYGGDLKGISLKLDYLKALGVNVIYINPLSKSISNHRYDTTDYGKVDPILGHTEDFINLAKAAKERGMHIILDGVFNHVSDDSVYFDRYGKYTCKNKPIGAYQYWSKVYDKINLKNLKMEDAEKEVTKELYEAGITDLHYKDWFKIDNVKVKASDGDPEHYSYEGWWGYDSMPVIEALNGSEYNVKSWDNEIIDGKDANSRYWLRQGSNGWRLDVANEVSDETWRHFRQAVKEEGDNVIIGEIWDDASKYLLGDMYDSVMNYRFRTAIMEFVKGQDESGNKVSAAGAMAELEKMREQYPKEAFYAMLNLVDSHDTQRIISAMDGYKKDAKDVAKAPTNKAYSKMKLVPLLQMTYPGAPCIYYGDEAGIAGADDPDNRRAMIWGKGNKELVLWYAKLANTRNAYKSLRTGDFEPITLDNEVSKDAIAFSRNDGEDHAFVVINRGENVINNLELSVNASDGTVLTNALNESETYTVKDGKIKINVQGENGAILVSKFKEVSIKENSLRDAFDPSYIVKIKSMPLKDSLEEDAIKSIEKCQDSSITLQNNVPLTKDILITAANKNLKTISLFLDENKNIKFTFDTSKILDTLNSFSASEVPLSYDDITSKDSALKESLGSFKDNLIKAFDFTNGLPGGKFNSDVNVSIKLSNINKNLYLYYVNPNGTFEFIPSDFKDGEMHFTISHCSKYIIMDKELTLDADGKLKITGKSISSSESITGKLPKTGYFIDANLLYCMGLIMLLSGAAFVHFERKKEK